MTNRSGPEPIYSPYQTVRDRCRALGLPTWSCDSRGSIIHDPTLPGLAGLWLRSAEIVGLVTQAARTWLDEAHPEVIEASPGCWLIPVVEESRRRRIGLTIAMALGPRVLDAELFALACKSSQLDPHATRSIIRRLARFDEASAQRQVSTLSWMLRDLTTLAEYQGAVDGFTTELTKSYETIDLVYTLGRSMLDLEHPEKFVNLVCDRLFETLQFGWMAARFADDSKVSGSLASLLLVRGTPPCAGLALGELVDRLLTRVGVEPRNILVAHADETALAGDGRAIVQPIVRAGRIAGILIASDKQGDDPQVSSYDMQLLEAASGYIGAFIENAGHYGDQQAMFLGSLRALTASIDAKDRYTCGHSERVAYVASRLALAAGLTQEQAERVHICGLVHDVGKIGVPEAVLSKAGRLTEDEFALIKLHPEIGHRILRDIPLLSDVLPGVMSHHERWDGRGYPHGLKADQIPLYARLIGLADTFDAMSSTRSYRAAMPREKVLAEIARCAGSQFDPALAGIFGELDLSGYDDMVARHAREHDASSGRVAA